MKKIRNCFLALGLLGGMACSKGDSGNGTEPLPTNPEKSTLKVMTYNIHIANPPSQPETVVDIDAIANVIKKEQPDLVALQEVDKFTLRSGKSLDQAKEIAAKTGMYYFFAKAINRSEGEYGVAVLSKFPIENTKVVSLPVTSGSAAELRALGIIELSLPNKQKIAFGSLHLDHLTDDNRQLQVREALKVLAQYSDYPVIIGGDFNMPPQNTIWNSLKESFVLPCTSCPYTFSAANPTTTIDYLLLSKKASSFFKVKSYATVAERYASDHLPLMMVLEY